MSIKQNVTDEIQNFLNEVTNNNRLSIHDLERVLVHEEDNLTSSDLNQKPETFTENKLIFPLLKAVGVEFDEQPHGQSGARQKWPDFGTVNLDEYVVGESKSLNNVDKGRTEIKEYLDSISIGSEFGIVTDGLVWEIYSVERGGDITEFPLIKRVDLRQLIIVIAQKNGYIHNTSVGNINVDEELEEFIEVFSRDSLNNLVSVEAPQFLRKRRKRGVEDFYDLYIELLFGEGDDYSYDTHLMEDIIAPKGTSEDERRQFGVTLMNRLLFIKILETKKVVPEGLLKDRLDTYEENEGAFMHNFYDSQLKPLFYDLLNTKEEKRTLQHRQGWADEIPYLNGGLFRENVPDEKHYTVEDRILTEIIRDLIEGSKIGENENRLDPAILGSVFEMTINFMGGEFGSQNDIGAYYTPSDATHVVTEQSVDYRIKDILVETALSSSGV